MSSSRVVGKQEPTAFTCAPRASQRFSTIGSRAAVVVQTTSAPKSAASTEGAHRRADLAGELLGSVRVARPDADLRVVEHRPHGVHVPAGLRARPEDRDPLGVRAGEGARRDRGDRRGSYLRDRGGVHDREQLARVSVVQQDAAHVGVETSRRVRRHDDDLLERVRGRGAALDGRA